MIYLICMQTLEQRQKIIQQKRKKTSFRDFLLEIASWCPLKFYKNQWYISRYPNTERSNTLTDIKNYEEIRNEWVWLDYSWDFFKDFKQLIDQSTLPAMVHGRWAGECHYADAVFGSDTVYLSSTVVWWSSHVFYSVSVKQNCHNVYNSMMIYDNCENIYQSVWIVSSSNIFYSIHIQWGFDMWFCVWCIWSRNCIRCNGLQNTQYAVDNKVIGKENYLKAKEELLKDNMDFDKLRDKLSISEPITFQCNDVENVHMAYRLHQCRNTLFVGWPEGNEDVYDMCIWWGSWTKHAYGCMAGWKAEHMYCCVDCDGSSHHYYSYNTEDSSHCIWCVGLKNKQFCILNKQYTKEERYTLAHTIFAELDGKGVLGQGFPKDWNPYYLNDTPAGLLLDITKQEAEQQWFLRRDESTAIDLPEDVKIIPSQELQHIAYWKEAQRYIDPSIESAALFDPDEWVFKVTPQERVFLMKFGLPVPTKHWLKRMQSGLRVCSSVVE